MARKKNRIGEIWPSYDGAMLEIIEYTSWDNLVVRNIETGREEKCSSYSRLKKGEVGSPEHKNDIKKKARIGEQTANREGLLMEIVAYRRYSDIDVRFIDDGVVVKHKTYGSFKEGAIRHPDFMERRIGEEFTNNIGQTARITGYKGCDDVEITFLDDGTVKEGVHYKYLLAGSFYKTTDEYYEYKSKRKEKIGSKATATNGMVMTCVGYSDKQHVRVQFEDGYEVVTQWYNFVKGHVAHPSVDSYEVGASKRRIIGRVGEKVLQKCGQHAEIIEYKNCREITVQFESGLTKATRYRSFSAGELKEPVKYAGFQQISQAWNDKGEYYYNCKCKECGYKDILTPSQMIEHHSTHSDGQSRQKKGD